MTSVPGLPFPRPSKHAAPGPSTNSLVQPHLALSASITTLPRPHPRPAPLPTTNTQPLHKPVRKALPTTPPQIPVSSVPGPLGLCRRRGKPLTGCAADAQAVWGGHGAGRGGGETKRQNKLFFFFYILHREGCLQAGVPPRATFRGPRVPRCPLPFLSWTPVPPAPKGAPTLPRAGRQGSQAMGRGLVSPFLEGPRPLVSEGDGHLGNPSRTGDHCGAEGLANPTSPCLWEGDE